MSKATKGHLLLADGQAVLNADGEKNKWPLPVLGRAACSCGERSDVLNTNRRRRSWFRDHQEELKAAARKAAAEQPEVSGAR